MVITRRSSETACSYERSSAKGGVQILERPRAVGQTASAASETQDQAKERMQRNLDRLLNYDRYAEQQVENVATQQDSAQSQYADEDIRPTSTTMQFGDDIDQIREEMVKNSAVEEEEGSYRLNAKGKLAVILYSLAVAVILALIVLNTGVLATLSGTAEAKAAELDVVMERYSAIESEIKEISSSDYIIEQAEKLEMVKGN